jgi:ABC-type lipoprotein release transport system permease subunit
MQLWRMAWRNLWRSPRRTVISMSAIALGLALVVIYGGIARAMIGEAKSQLDDGGAGHVEITAKDWRKSRQQGLVITDGAAVVQQLRSSSSPLPVGAEVSSRVVVRGLLASPRGTEAVELHGVDFDDERQVASYVRDIREGALPVEGDDVGVVIGDALAARLKVKPGQKLRLMVQRQDGEIGAELLRVRGIFHAGVAAIGRGRVLVDDDVARRALGLEQEGAVHQIVIQLPDASQTKPLAAAWKTALQTSMPAVEVMSLYDLAPIFDQLEQLLDSVMAVAALFVYFLVGLGIMNTLLMSVLERTREFGILQAIGTRPRDIVLLVLAESVLTAAIAVVVGLALGLSVTFAGTDGLMDFSDSMGETIEFSGMSIRAVFVTAFSVTDALKDSVWVFLMAIVVGLYPAWRVVRMSPVDAIRSR